MAACSADQGLPDTADLTRWSPCGNTGTALFYHARNNPSTISFSIKLVPGTFPSLTNHFGTNITLDIDAPWFAVAIYEFAKLQNTTAVQELLWNCFSQNRENTEKNLK